jgi:hypothetical protein
MPKLATVDHVADRLLVQLKEGRDLLDRQEFVWRSLNLTESNGRRLWCGP